MTKIIDRLKKITARTEKWLEKASAYMYNFKDGHFQFPYAPNDPELMIEAIKKTPFVVHNKAKQCLETDSSFMKIKMKYMKLDEGLWMTATRSHWKVNVKVIALAEDTPSEYYFLTYSRSTDSIDVKVTNQNLHFENNSHSWTLYKSTTALDAYFKKNCKVFTTLFIFNKSWFEKNIANHTDNNIHLIKQMLNANYAYKNYIYHDKEAINQTFIELYNSINDFKISQLDIPNLFTNVKQIILMFFNKSSAEDLLLINEPINAIKIKDRVLMERIEKRVVETLTADFVGIETLAKEFELSSTKLKSDFKAVFGHTILQYYQKKQMELSVELIKQNLNIGLIAKTLGYENASKFTAKFKETFGVLPSKYF